jgi:hypothetical protein
VRRDLTTISISLEREEIKTRERSVLGQFIFIRVRLFKKRVHRTRFELTKTPEAIKRKINDSSYGG